MTIKVCPAVLANDPIVRHSVKNSSACCQDDPKGECRCAVDYMNGKESRFRKSRFRKETTMVKSTKKNFDKQWDRLDPLIHGLIESSSAKPLSLSRKEKQRRILFVNRNTNLKSVYIIDDFEQYDDFEFRDRNRLRIIQILSDKKEKEIGYNTYGMRLNERKDLLWWYQGWISPEIRGAGIGKSLALSQVRAIEKEFSDIKIKIVDGSPCTEAGRKLLGHDFDYWGDYPERSKFRIK